MTPLFMTNSVQEKNLAKLYSCPADWRRRGRVCPVAGLLISAGTQGEMRCISQVSIRPYDIDIRWALARSLLIETYSKRHHHVLGLRIGKYAVG